MYTLGKISSAFVLICILINFSKNVQLVIIVNKNATKLEKKNASTSLRSANYVTEKLAYLSSLLEIISLSAILQLVNRPYKQINDRSIFFTHTSTF